MIGQTFQPATHKLPDEASHTRTRPKVSPLTRSAAHSAACIGNMLRCNIVVKAVFQGRTSDGTTADASVNAVPPWGKLYPIQRYKREKHIAGTALMVAAICALLQTLSAAGERGRTSNPPAWCVNPGPTGIQTPHAQRARKKENTPTPTVAGVLHTSATGSGLVLITCSELVLEMGPRDPKSTGRR